MASQGTLMAKDAHVPAGSKPIAMIDRHPADLIGFGYLVVRFLQTGAEVAWDGEATRALPLDWRDLVKWDEYETPD